MKRSELTLFKTDCGGYHAVIKTNHGRKLYLAVTAKENRYCIRECFYIDRSRPCVPQKLITKQMEQERLLEMIRLELDKDFGSVCVRDEVISKEVLLSKYLNMEKKHILLMLQDGHVLTTIFKNKFGREIYLEIALEGNRGLIHQCRYCDKRAGDKEITPHGLLTVYYEHSLSNLLHIVNDELEGGFSDIVISDTHTIVLDRAICGRI